MDLGSKQQICKHPNMTKNIANQQQDFAGTPTSPVAANDTESDNLKLLDHMTHHSGDHKADLLTFFGFAPLRKRLSGHALDFLLHHLRWAKPEDPPEVVGKKNVIIMFTIHAEIEDCICHTPFTENVDKSKSLSLLQQLLGISYMKGPRAYTFARAILKAYTNSRHEQIILHLHRDQWPPEPETPIDKVLLSVVDRRLLFVFTRQPLHTTLVTEPHSRLQHHRMKLERLLSSDAEVEKVFRAFTPMVPEAKQKAWPKPWHITSWIQEQERRFRKTFTLPQLIGAPNGAWYTKDRGVTVFETDEDVISLRTSYIPAPGPDSSEVSWGISIYKSGIRHACNSLSTSTTTVMIRDLSDKIFGIIEGFANSLERHLASHPPDSVGQHQAADQDHFSAATTLIHPVGVEETFQIGIQMVLGGLHSENLSLVRWSWVAAEVQGGKVAVQNACEQALARYLPHELGPVC